MFALVLATVAIAAPEEATPTFSAVTSAEERPSGRIVRMEPDLSAVLSVGGRELVLKDLISLRRNDRPLPPFPTGPHLITTTGDRIVGRLRGGDAQSLRFFPSSLKLKLEDGWKVPLSSAVVLWLAAVPADTPLEPARYEWIAENRNRDLLRFRNGDTDRGTLSGLDPDGVGPTFNFRPEQGQTRVILGEELSAIAFNPTLARTRKPKGAYLRITLADSTRLHLISPALAGSELTGETLFGLKVAIPLLEILSIDVMRGKATYLSDLKPHKVEQTGFLGVTWPWVADRSVHNALLRASTGVGESVFDKGIGTHPRTWILYDLAGKYRRFDALVGLDPTSPVRGRAKVRILVDGKEQTLPELANLESGNAIRIRLKLEGAKELVLVTDFGPAGGVGADVNWCEARVVE